MTDTERTIRCIALTSLVPSPENVRKTPAEGSAFEQLKASIAAHGLLENLLVRPQAGDAEAETRYEVIAGGRRLAALSRWPTTALSRPIIPFPATSSRTMTTPPSCRSWKTPCARPCTRPTRSRRLRASPPTAAPSRKSPRGSASPSARWNRGCGSATPRRNCWRPTGRGTWDCSACRRSASPPIRSCSSPCGRNSRPSTTARACGRSAGS